MPSLRTSTRRSTSPPRRGRRRCRPSGWSTAPVCPLPQGGLHASPPGRQVRQMVAKLLISKQASVDAEGKNRVTPLHVAVHYDNQNLAMRIPALWPRTATRPLTLPPRQEETDRHFQDAACLRGQGAECKARFSQPGGSPGDCWAPDLSRSHHQRQGQEQTDPYPSLPPGIARY